MSGFAVAVVVFAVLPVVAVIGFAAVSAATAESAGCGHDHTPDGGDS